MDSVLEMMGCVLKTLDLAGEGRADHTQADSFLPAVYPDAR